MKYRYSKKLNSIYPLLLMTTFVVIQSSGCKTPAIQKHGPLGLPNTFQSYEVKADSLEGTQPPALQKDQTKVSVDSIRMQMSRENWITDKMLLQLIEKAHKNNPDYSIAIQKLMYASADLYRKRAAFLPEVEGVVVAGATRFGKYTIDGVGNFDTNLSPNISKDQQVPDPFVPDYFIGLRGSWEADLWGKLKWAKTGALLQTQAAESAVQTVKMELTAQVTALYYEMLAKKAEIDILQRNRELQKTALDIIQIQKTGGRATELAVQQFKAQLLQTAELLVVSQKDLAVLENTMGLLLADPSFKFQSPNSLYQVQKPQQLPGVAPEWLLTNRPDLKELEWQWRSAEAWVEHARKLFLPSLTVTPMAGFNGFNAGLLFTPESMAFSAVGSLAAPLLNRRALKAHQREKQAMYLETFEQYRKRMLTAVSEVNTAMAEISYLQHSIQLKKQETETLRQAISTANDLFLGGYANYLEVITAQKAVLVAEMDLISRYKDWLLAHTKLYRSLGGQ